jgi:hypothetical protein
MDPKKLVDPKDIAKYHKKLYMRAYRKELQELKIKKNVIK